MPSPNLTVIYMGSPEFAVPTLEALIAAPDMDVVCVVTQPDRPKGRGKRLAKTAVKLCAESHGLATLDMSKKNYDEVAAKLAAFAPDFLVVAAFGIILKDDLLDLPKRGCVNLHASLLPGFRGVSPVQAVILAGEAETGCTTMLIDAGIDTGDILQQKTTPIRDDDTAGSLEERLAELGAPLVVDTLRGIVTGSVTPQKQNDDDASYTKMIRKRHGSIKWTEPAEAIQRRVLAMQPWPTAYTSFGERRLILVETRWHAQPESSGAAGTVASTSPLLVNTGDGTLEIVRLKVAGKKEMTAQAFVAGYRLGVGDKLGPAND